MPTEADLLDFIGKLEDEMVSIGGGKMQMDSVRVGKLVRDHPELTILAARGYLAGAGTRWGSTQLAVVLGSIYLQEHQDDSLLRLVEEEIQAKRLEYREPELIPRPGEPGRGSGGDGILRQLSVDASDLARADVYGFVRFFSYRGRGHDELEALRQLRGTCVLSLPLDHDPRYVWEIPEARAFMRALAERVPHLPYFLHPAPELRLMLVFFGCAGDPEAIVGEGEINILHPSVVRRVLASFRAVVELCRLLGDDPAEVVRSALQAWPADYTESVVGALELA